MKCRHNLCKHSPVIGQSWYSRFSKFFTHFLRMHKSSALNLQCSYCHCDVKLPVMYRSAYFHILLRCLSATFSTFAIVIAAHAVSSWFFMAIICLAISVLIPMLMHVLLASLIFTFSTWPSSRGQIEPSMWCVNKSIDTIDDYFYWHLAAIQSTSCVWILLSFAGKEAGIPVIFLLVLSAVFLIQAHNLCGSAVTAVFFVLSLSILVFGNYAHNSSEVFRFIWLTYMSIIDLLTTWRREHR